MKFVKVNALLASMLGAGALLMAVPLVSNASAGLGWDVFNVGDGQVIPTESGAYMGTSLASATGLGWDAFNVGDGQPIPSESQSYMGTSLEAAPSGDSDIFRVN